MKEEHKENFKLVIPFFDKRNAKKVQELLKDLVINNNRYFILSYIEGKNEI